MEKKLTEAQLDGLACVECGADARTAGPMAPTGMIDGRQVFACVRCIEEGNEEETTAEPVELQPVPIEFRRNLLMVMATDPHMVVRFLEECGSAALPYLLHSICAELASVALNYEEDIPPVKDAIRFMGGMVGGLMFGEGLAPNPHRDPDDDVSRLHHAAQTQGAKILAGAGVAPFV